MIELNLWPAYFLCPTLDLVTTVVGKPSATSQPNRPTQPITFSGSINELQLDVCYRLALSGKGNRGNCKPGRK